MLVVLSVRAMESEDGPLLLQRLVRRLYNSGRIQGRFAPVSGIALFETCRHHNFKFCIPAPHGSGSNLLLISDEHVKALMNLIIEGYFRFRDDSLCLRDGYEALVDSLRYIESNGLDPHIALFGTPYVQTRDHE